MKAMFLISLFQATNTGICIYNVGIDPSNGISWAAFAVAALVLTLCIVLTWNIMGLKSY